MAKFGIKYVGKKKIFPTPVELENALEKRLTLMAADVQVDFIKTTENWADSVTFTINTQPMLREIGTSNQIFGFVSKGTPVRFATMSPDFIAKTRPGSLNSIAGSGKKWFVNKNKPKPGIKARNFDQQLAKKYEKKLGPEIQKDLARLFK